MAITSCRTSYIKPKCLILKPKNWIKHVLLVSCVGEKWDLRFCPTCSAKYSRSREYTHGTKSSKNAQTSTSFGTTTTITSKKTSSVPGDEDIVTMISKAESNIPELLSAVEATDRSGKEIHKSIQSAIRELSTTADDISRGSNITEEIGKKRA